MYQRRVHSSWCMVWSMQFLSFWKPCLLIFMFLCIQCFSCLCVNCRKSVDLCHRGMQMCSPWDGGRQVMWESRCCLTVFFFPPDNDCGDNSDEAGCSHSCSSAQFKCNSGRCIPDYWTCDGDNDCGDYSDETHANCTNQGECPVRLGFLRRADGWETLEYYYC